MAIERLTERQQSIINDLLKDKVSELEDYIEELKEILREFGE